VKKWENKKLLKELGKRIRKFRREQDISQSQLGFECGVHGEYIGRIERGLQSPTITTLDNIAKALGIKLKELIDFDY
jgi:transcriptional regulator with XRE-family HTH domain